MQLQFVGCGDAFGSGGRLNTCIRVTGARTDFLIDCGGRVVVCKHGSHAYDQWSVGELLAYAR